MIIAPITTERVELRRLACGMFILRVGANTIRLTPQAVEDVDRMTFYPDGNAAMTVHRGQEYRAHRGIRVTAELVACIGAYDKADKTAPEPVASEPLRKRQSAFIPLPNRLTLALTGRHRTYVAELTRQQALDLGLTAAPRVMSDAA